MGKRSLRKHTEKYLLFSFVGGFLSVSRKEKTFCHTGVTVIDLVEDIGNLRIHGVVGIHHVVIYILARENIGSRLDRRKHYQQKHRQNC